MIDTLLQQKQAVIFDLDGTLVDSMWMWKAIDIEYLGSFGYECPPDLQKSIEGMSFTETAYYFQKRFHLPCTISQIKETWTNMSIEKYRTQVPLKKGAGAFLEYVKQQQIPMGIATSNEKAIAETVLQALQVRPFFQVLITGCEVAAGKPAPDVYLQAAKQLNASPGHCLVFEDIPAGIRAGKAAGMTVVAVDDEFSKEMRIEKENLADYFIKDYQELLKGPRACGGA